uniref:Uncharacterized protein n=1 Tax=Knipowitschia caucasica TaxID=637954 RepID=A0AAV2L251_KNICA
MCRLLLPLRLQSGHPPSAQRPPLNHLTGGTSRSYGEKKEYRVDLMNSTENKHGFDYGSDHALSARFRRTFAVVQLCGKSTDTFTFKNSDGEVEESAPRCVESVAPAAGGRVINPAVSDRPRPVADKWGGPYPSSDAPLWMHSGAPALGGWSRAAGYELPK